MDVISLNGLQTKKITIDESTQALILQNVCASAVVKVTVQKEGFDDIKPIPSMTVAKVIELQSKVRALNVNKDFISEIEEVATTDSGVVNVFPLAMIHLGLDGEIDLGDNDKIIVEFTSGLGKVATDCNLKPLEGSRKSTRYVDFKKLTYQASKDEKMLDLNGISYLAFDTIPDEISLFYENEIKRVDALTLKAINKDNFGLVRVVKGVNDYGTSDMYIIPVHEVVKCVIKDETQTNDFDIITIA